jgi:hypothetical protein
VSAFFKNARMHARFLLCAMQIVTLLIGSGN